MLVVFDFAGCDFDFAELGFDFAEPMFWFCGTQVLIHYHLGAPYKIPPILSGGGRRRSHCQTHGDARITTDDLELPCVKGHKSRRKSWKTLGDQVANTYILHLTWQNLLYNTAEFLVSKTRQFLTLSLETLFLYIFKNEQNSKVPRKLSNGCHHPYPLRTSQRPLKTAPTPSLFECRC